MGFRYQFILDEETSKAIQTIPDKKKSEYVRTAIKSYENSKKQAEIDAEKPIVAGKVRR